MPAKKADLKKAARWYAEHSWHVFPVAPNAKRPLTKNGFKDASIDLAQIDEWWSKWPDANIGLACEMSGIVALDGDPAHYDDDARVLVESLKGSTSTQSTPSGGVHYLYMQPTDTKLTNSPGTLPAGIDVRVRGYILLAPSAVTYIGEEAGTKGVADGHLGCYEWTVWPHSTPPQPLPDHIFDMLHKPERKPAPPSATHTNGNHVGEERYAAAALEKELEVLNNTPDGNRNNQLNISSMKLGQLVAGGLLDEADVINKLEIVARGIGLDDSAIKKTISSGFSKGKTEPRSAPETPTLVFGRHAEGDEPDAEDIPKDEDGRPKFGPTKKIQLLLRQMGYVFQLNELRDRIELADGSPLHDGEQATIVAQLFEQGVKNKSLILDVMLAEAWANRYDPLSDFLNNLEWDGTDYIDMLGGWFICKNEPMRMIDGSLKGVFSIWLRRWLIGAVGKALDGVQNPMLVLAGNQGIGKSEFARWLCSPLSDYFISSPIVPDNIDHLRWLAGNFIWEVAELGATTRKADIEGLKAFLTRPECTYRVPYAKNEVHRPARASFIGTINLDNAGFLMDTTGNRRFLSAELLGIQWEAYTANIDPMQLWAQAAYLYKQDSNSWQLTPEEEDQRDEINEGYGAEDPILDALETFYKITAEAEPDDSPFMPTTEIVHLLANSVHEPTTRQLQLGIAKALRRLNATKGRKGGVRGVRGYWGMTRQFAGNDND